MSCALRKLKRQQDAVWFSTGKDYRPLDKSDVTLVQPIFNEHVLYVQNCTKCQEYKAESGTIFKKFSQADILANSH